MTATYITIYLSILSNYAFSALEIITKNIENEQFVLVSPEYQKCFKKFNDSFLDKKKKNSKKDPENEIQKISLFGKNHSGLKLVNKN